MVALVADNSLYLIDTQTGEDLISPAFVGERVNIRIMHDGIILVGTGRADNIMKVDFEGNILWRSSADIDVGSNELMQIVNGNIVLKLFSADWWEQRMVVVDMQTGNILLEVDISWSW